MVTEDIKLLSDDGIIEVLQNQPRRMKAVLFLLPDMSVRRVLHAIGKSKYECMYLIVNLLQNFEIRERIIFFC